MDKIIDISELIPDNENANHRNQQNRLKCPNTPPK